MLHLPFVRNRRGDDLVLGRLGKHPISPLFRVAASTRSAHMYVIGTSGKGKSKLLEWCLNQDTAAGRGCGLIDPHSLLVDDLPRLLITPYIPKADTSANRKLGLFAKDDFRYDPEQDCHRCPADEKLTFRFQTTEKGPERRYYATPACSHCVLKAKRTRSKDGRRIPRWIYEDVLEEMEARVQDEPDQARLRKTIAEHPFGTIKRHMDQGYFLMRGLPNVGAEMSLTLLAYNIKRAIKILGVPKMAQARA